MEVRSDRYRVTLCEKEVASKVRVYRLLTLWMILVANRFFYSAGATLT